MDEKYANWKRLYLAEGELTFYLAVFGDEIAKRNGYKEHEGIDAIVFYLCNKLGRLPAEIRSLHPNDLRFLLAEEMQGWTAPEAARA